MTVRARTVGIAVAAVVGIVLLLNALAGRLDNAVGGNQTGGATGSSYATSPSGAGAYPLLLGRYGYAVERSRGELIDAELPAGSTLMVLEPDRYTPEDFTAMLDFVTRGGRLVIGGTAPFYLRNLRDTPPSWVPVGRNRWTTIDPSLGDLDAISTAGQGAFSDPGTGTAVVGTSGDALVTYEQLGRGELFTIADTSPLSNDYLDRADNAAFAIALAGPEGRRVIFAEGVHGYESQTGWRAIPSRWKGMLALIGCAVLILVWSRSRRFGPPDRAARALPPPRGEYVRALASTLERTADRGEALGDVQRWARDAIAARAGLRPDASDDEVAAAAATLGFGDDEIRAVLAPRPGGEDVGALARALERAGTERSGT